MRNRVALTALLCAALATPLQGQTADKTRVQVTLRIEQPALRTFDDADRQWLEAEGAKLIGRKLSGIGFLDFTNETGPSHQLVFHLDDLDRSRRGSISDVVYHVQLTGDAKAELSRGQWLFRTADEYMKQRGSRDQFLQEIRASVERGSLAALQAELLSQIPLARQVLVWDNPRGWAIAHKQGDLCLEKRSRLRIETAVAENGVSKPQTFMASKAAGFTPTRQPPKDFRGGTFLWPDPPAQEGLERYTWTSSTSVEAVYVEEYRRLATGCRVAPDNPGGQP